MGQLVWAPVLLCSSPLYSTPFPLRLTFAFQSMCVTAGNVFSCHIIACPRSSVCFMLPAGDVDQLPPVGPGTVLADAIRSGVVPVIDLREIFRQAQQSAIVGAAHAILSGSLPSLLQRLQHVKPSSIQASPVHHAVVVRSQQFAAEMGAQ